MTGRLQFVFISQLPTCACRTGWLAVLWGPTSQVRVCVVLVSLGMLDRDDCTSCAALLEGPILSTGKIQAHHLQYHPTLAKTEGKIVGVRPAFIIHHRYAVRAHRSLVKGRSQACVLIGSTMLLVTVTVCNRSTAGLANCDLVCLVNIRRCGPRLLVKVNVCRTVWVCGLRLQV